MAQVVKNTPTKAGDVGFPGGSDGDAAAYNV